MRIAACKALASPDPTASSSQSPNCESISPGAIESVCAPVSDLVHRLWCVSLCRTGACVSVCLQRVLGPPTAFVSVCLNERLAWGDASLSSLVVLTERREEAGKTKWKEGARRGETPPSAWDSSAKMWMQRRTEQGPK